MKAYVKHYLLMQYYNKTIDKLLIEVTYYLFHDNTLILSVI